MTTGTDTNTPESGITIVPDVEIVYRTGPWEITAEWPQRSRRSDITSIMRIHYLGADEGHRLALSSTRVGLYSTTGKNAVIAAMRKHVTDTDNQTSIIIHRIVEHLLEQYRQAGATLKPQPEPYPGDMFLLYPMWPAIGGTLLVAPSNGFKSFLVAAVAVQSTVGAELLHGNTRLAAEPRPIRVLDWEAGTPAFAERLYAVLRGAGLPTEPCVAYKHLNRPFVEIVDQLAEEVKRHGYGGVIIDSISAAMGASLNEDEPANLFWDAVDRLDVPALVTAHKNKEAVRRNHKGPFGSVMHTNRPRMIWDGMRETDSQLVRWECINDNNTGHGGNTLAWRVNIQNVGEHEHRRLDTVTFEAVNPNDVRMAPNEGDTLADRIGFAITEYGAATHGEIALTIGANQGSVKAALHRHKTLFVKKGDGRWELA